MRHKKILKERAAAEGGWEVKPAAPVEAEPGTDAFDPKKPPKPLDQMSMTDQLQWS